MKRHPDTRGILYFLISVLTVWSGELANLGGEELFKRIHDRWPALVIASLLAGLVAVRAYIDQHLSRSVKELPQQPKSTV